MRNINVEIDDDIGAYLDSLLEGNTRLTLDLLARVALYHLCSQTPTEISVLVGRYYMQDIKPRGPSQTTIPPTMRLNMGDVGDNPRGNNRLVHEVHIEDNKKSLQWLWDHGVVSVDNAVPLADFAHEILARCTLTKKLSSAKGKISKLIRQGWVKKMNTSDSIVKPVWIVWLDVSEALKEGLIDINKKQTKRIVGKLLRPEITFSITNKFIQCPECGGALFRKADDIYVCQKCWKHYPKKELEGVKYGK
jgi:hypothetical protein